MKGRNMRLMDLFLEMDADGSGSLSRQELRDALQRMCAPAVHKNRATELREKKAALARKKAAREDEERRLRQEAQKRMQDKLKRVKDAKIDLGRPSTRAGGTGSQIPASSTSSFPPRAVTSSPSLRPRLKKLSKRPKEICVICGGDKASKGCQMYHEMVEFTISLETKGGYKHSPQAIGPFKRHTKWVDPVSTYTKLPP